MECDAEILLLLIEQRPAIYNYTMKDYSNRTAIEKLWEEIGAEMGLSVAECKAKWGSLRNSFNRAVRKDRDMASSSKRRKVSKQRKWYLMDSMEFLRDFVGVHGRLGCSITCTNSEDNLEETAEPLAADPDIEECSNSAVIQPDEFNNFSNLASKLARTRKKAVTVDPIIPMATVLESRTKESEPPDNTTLMFFQSLIPDVEKLTESRKRKFKIYVLNELCRNLDEQEDFAYFNNAAQLPIPNSIAGASSS